MKKLELKNYLKDKEKELNQEIIKKLSEGINPTVEIRMLGLIQNIINICESRNRY